MNNNSFACKNCPASYGEEWTILAKYALDMYEKHLKVLGKEDRATLNDFAEWMFAPSDDALLFDVGDIVTYKDNNETRYGVVEGYSSNPYQRYQIYRVKVKTPSGGIIELCPEQVSKAQIPADILQIAKNQLKAKCPMLND